MTRLILRSLFLASVVCSLVLPGLLRAQSTARATGSITGHVYNPATQEFVRNAEVRVADFDISAVTEAGGYFRLANVPAGAAKVTVTFAGYAPTSASVTVVAGETATHEFEIATAEAVAAGRKGKDGEAIVELDAFVVSAEREGNAKALQQQRSSMNMSRAVASDTFGDVTEGNVGEFLKYLPGVELEYVEADTRGPRLGGMGSEYTSVSMDGMKLASADAFTQYVAFENTAAGGANRSFGFEQVSINSIESIVINRVTSAAMDADAPAGNIDLRMRRAFDRKGRYTALNVSTVLNTEEFTLDRTPGPNDGLGRKVRPNWSLDYSDSFLNQRLGFVVGLSQSNLYNEQYRVDHTYNRTTVAGDTRPQVLTSILLKDGPKWTRRSTASFTADVKASDVLTLSFGFTYNGYDARFYNRQVTLQAAANNTGATTGRQTVSGDGVLSYGTTGASTAASRLLIFGGGNGVKNTNSLSFIPRFEYRRNNWVVDGAFAYSHSLNNYDNLRHGTVGNTTVNNVQNLGFTATRSNNDSADWKFTQTGGADWANLASFTNPRISDDKRHADNEVYSAELNAKYTLPFRRPSQLLFGLKSREFYYRTSNTNPYEVWSYVGPGGNTPTTTTGTFANFPGKFQFYDNSQVGATFTSLTGGGAPVFPDRDALGLLYQQHPEYFYRGESVVNATSYEQALFTNNRDLVEAVTAAYVMANTKLAKLQLQGGFRYENTEVTSKEWDVRAPSEIVAAGFPVTTAGVPTTWTGMNYKYASQPRVKRTGEYHDLFPSMTAKYSFTDRLLGDLGWGKTIKRPNVGLLSGVWSIDEVNQVVNAANPKLKPEHSEKVVASLTYFFNERGNSNVQLVASHNKIKNLQSNAVFTSEEYGNTDPTYADYDFVTSNNLGNPVTFRSLELSYLQQLNFLPSFLQGTAFNGSYTRTYASERRPGVVPHSLKGGLSWRYGRVGLSFNGVWRDETPWFQGRSDRVLKANVKYDFGGSVTLTKSLSFYFQGRNVFEEPHRIYETSAGNPNVLFRYENYGTNWTFGMKGKF